MRYDGGIVAGGRVAFKGVWNRVLVFCMMLPYTGDFWEVWEELVWLGLFHFAPRWQYAGPVIV